jgi:hypothetical protein
VIILRFGRNGRLAGICRAAAELRHPSVLSFHLTRDGGFRQDSNGLHYSNIEMLARGYPGQSFLVMDASVDHSSQEAMVAHECLKRECISWLDSKELLSECVGFSSGITLIDPSQFQNAATHMLEYRRQKIAQEDLFLSLSCQVFLPQLFTVIGPRTYASQKAAWAQIFRARLERATGTVLHHPHSRRAWASEFEVFRQLLGFLQEDLPGNITGPIVQGEFTLAEIAGSRQLPLPALAYDDGQSSGWLKGDYLPSIPLDNPQFIADELLRTLYF